MSEIIPGLLYLGNFNDSQNAAFLSSIHVKVIVNCTKDLPFLDGIQSTAICYRIPVNDDLRDESMTEMTAALHHIIPRLIMHYHNGEPIFIHCYAGMQRSAVVTLAFLYLIQTVDSRQRTTDRDLIVFLKARRDIVFFPSFNFQRAYIRWKQHVQSAIG